MLYKCLVIERTKPRITILYMFQLLNKICLYKKDLSSDFTFYPLVTGPVHSCAISTPRGAYSPAAVSAHWTHRTHCHLCPTRYSYLPESSEAFEGEVPWPRTQHLNNVPRLRGEKHDIPLKILHQPGFKTVRQAATSAERHALTIAPCPSQIKQKWIIFTHFAYPERQNFKWVQCKTGANAKNIQTSFKTFHN